MHDTGVRFISILGAISETCIINVPTKLFYITHFLFVVVLWFVNIYMRRGVAIPNDLLNFSLLLPSTLLWLYQLFWIINTYVGSNFCEGTDDDLDGRSRADPVSHLVWRT